MQDVIPFKKNTKRPIKINKKRMATTIIVAVILLIILIMLILYYTNKPVRKFLDKYLFGKDITEETLTSIPLEYESDISVIGHHKYINVLVENTLKQYNSSGDLANEIKLQISNPTYKASDKYLAISEKGSSKIYLISDTKILWEKEVDGNVEKIDVNKNGYVSVILTGTTHKSVIAIYDNKGNELFKTYLASTIALDATISQDNKYLAFAEINTSGTTIQSNIKILSIEKAKTEPSEATIYVYKADTNSLATNIEYQNKNRLVCMYDDSIHIISDENDETILKLQEENQKVMAADINLKEWAYRAIEKQTGLFQADTVIEMINVENKRQTIYTAEGVAKKIYCNDDKIAIDLGQEIEFINTSGWMIKHYTSSQDIQNIEMANNLAGIIYQDKIELVNL